jgi:subtilisin-like proprotein convertase family protein
MKSSRKYPYRLLALLVVFVAICIALPQLSSMSEFSRNKSASIKSKQEPQSVKAEKDNLPSGKESPDEFSTITIPAHQVPKQRIAAPQAVAAATKQDEVEPNSTTGTASPITGRSAKVIGNLYPNGDIDFYSFTANAGDRFYAATMTSGSAGNSTDSQLTLIASDGTTTIEFDDDNGSFAALSSSIAGATIPTTGTYFIRVNDFTAGTTSERGYELWFQLQNGSPTAEVEANDTPATANPLPASGWVSGARNPAAATEQDWYSMSLNAGDTVYLSLDVDPERDGVVWNGRLGFALFGDASNQILVVDDAGTGDVSPVPNRPSEAFFMTVKDAGTFFAFVDSASAAVGGPTATYHLNVTVLPRPVVGVNCTTYTSTDVPKTIGPGTGLVSSTITIPGNPRIADIRVSITLNHALMQDVDVHLRSPAGNDNGLFTDIGAAATGGQTQMDLVFDDSAGIPPAFTALRGVQLKPENNSTAGTASTSGAYRLGWFKGENAGGTWTLDIRDDTAGANGGTLTAWSITICEEPPAPACGAGATQTVFSADFESGAAGFTHSGAQDEWELGLPATVATTTANPVAAFNTCNSGVNCWKTDLDNTYNASSNQELLSPNINLAGFAGPIRLTWAQRDQIETANFDHAFVEVREVGNPTNVKRVWEWIDPTPISASAGTGNPQANIGGSEGWGLRYADISSFAGLTIQVVFHLDTDTSVQFGGMAIDDVSVTACLAVVPCVLTCPANVTQTNDPNQCGAVVTYPAPTTSGGCGTVTCSPPSGSFFPVGTTTVTCQNMGGTPTCTFTVTVTDDQPPSITCPANVTVANDPNQCGAVVNYPAPTITDNCPGTFTATCTPPSGSFFPVGTTTVTCTVDGFGGGSRGAAPSGGCTTQTITHSSSQAITPLNSVSCNDGFGHTDNSYWRAFSLPAFSINTAFNVTSIDIGIEDAIGTAPGAAKKGTTPPPSGGGKGGAPAGASKKGISKNLLPDLLVVALSR